VTARQESLTRIRNILATATIADKKLTIPGQLDRTDYINVNKALEALGGKWSRRDRAHVFTSDPSAALVAFINGGDAPQPARTVEGYVATPGPIADLICTRYAKLAGLAAMDCVLEPSAGDGALVRAVLRVRPNLRIDAVEPNKDRAALIGHGVNAAVEVDTFENYALRCASIGARYQAVVMNPPFSVPGNRTIWIDHVRLAWDLLAPGGRLVAIVPSGLEHRQDRKHVELRALVSTSGGWDALPENAFMASGTGVRAAVLWMDRPAVAR
jgi:hypothetical protein